MSFLFKSRSKRRGAFPAATTTTTIAPTTTTTGVPTTTTTAAPGAWAPQLATYTSAGLTSQVNSDFGSQGVEGAFSPTGVAWYNMTDPRDTDVTAPNSSDILRHRTPGASLGGGTGQGTLETIGTNRWKRGYVCVSLKLDGDGVDPYTIHNVEEQFLFAQQFFVDTEASASQNQFLVAWNRSAGNWNWYCDALLGAARYNMNTTNYPLNNGTYKMVEMYIQMNTASNSDGVLKIWVDGVLIMDRSDIEFNDNGTNNICWGGFQFRNVRGGGDADIATPAGGQSRLFDRITFYSAPELATQTIDATTDYSSYTVNQTGVVEPYVTITRGGGYTGNVVLSVSGLPAGVVASFPSGNTFSGATATLPVRLTSTAAATVTNDAFTITATPSGALTTPIPINLTLTIQVAPAFAPNLASLSLPSMLFDSDMSDLDSRAEFPSPEGIRIYGQGDTFKQTDLTAPYGTTVYRHTMPGNHYGNGTGNGSLANEGQYWKKGYFCVMVKLEGDGVDPYKIHFNEEKFFFPVAYFDDLSGVSNTGVDLAWILRSGNWDSHLQNGLGSPRRYQNNAVYPLNNGSWNMLEYYIQINSPGNSDGVWKYWVNGVLAADFSDVQYMSGGSAQSFNGVRLITVRGGGVDDAPTPAGGQFRVHNRMAFHYSTTL